MAKPRVLISSDIGGADPDDIQSMVHAFLYADKVNLVGLVSTPTKHGGRASHIHKAIDAYEKDYQKLKTWSSEYPTPQYLDSITKQGNTSVAPSKGWSSSTAGSQQIIKAAHAASASDPLWVQTWGSMTDLAQALHDDPSIKSKIKVYSIGAWNTQQDPAARNYIYNSHKDLWWIENNSTFRGMYVNDSGAGKNSWNMNDAKGHGALGEHFYKAMPWGLKMGDTPSFLYMIDGADNNNPGANSWGGSFVKTGHGPNYWTDNKSSSLANGGYHGSETVQKHQSAFYKDFAMRLDRAKSAKDGSTPAPKPDPVDPPPSNPPPSNGNGNDPVVAGDDNYKIAVNETKYFNAKHLLLNDTGKDGGLKVSGMASKSAAGGTVSLSSDGTVKYTPVKGWQGKDSINYTLMDKDGSKDTGTVFIQVGKGTTTPPPSNGGGDTPPSNGGGNAPVVAGDDSYKTGVDQKWYFNTKYLTWNDKGADGGLKVSAVAAKSAAGATVTLDGNGTAVYTPVKGWQGKDSIDYTLVDKNGSKDTGTIYMQVGNGTSAPAPGGSTGDASPTPPPSTGNGNDPVVAGDDYRTINGPKSDYFNSKHLLLNDKAADGGLKVTDIPDYSAKGARVTWDEDTGTVIYRPKAGVSEDTLTYIIADKDGSKDTGVIHFDVLLA